MAGRNPPPRRTYGGLSAEERRSDRRKRLLEAGFELMGTQGYGGASIERICTRAGVSTRNFYEEFTGKEAVLIALHQQITERARDAVLATLGRSDPEAPTADRIEPAIRAYIEAVAGDVRRARIAYVEVIGVSAAVEMNRVRLRQGWTDLFVAEAARAAARGEAVDRDFRLSAAVIIGAINNMIHHWSLTKDEFDLDDIAVEITRLIKALLAAA